LGPAHRRHLADDLAGRGVPDRDRLAALGLDPFAVDAIGLPEQGRVLERQWRCGVQHGGPSGNSPECREPAPTCQPYSTVTDFARLRGWSTSVPFSTAT